MQLPARWRLRMKSHKKATLQLRRICLQKLLKMRQLSKRKMKLLYFRQCHLRRIGCYGSREIQKQNRRVMFMFKRKLCPNCKTGKYTYELDKMSPMCPYIKCYSANKCPMYVKLEKSHKDNLWRNLFKSRNITKK